MAVKDYDHDPDAHQGFVLASFCLQTSEPDAVLRSLIQDGAVIKVDETQAKRADGTAVLTGWAGRMPAGPLIYGYVKHSLREFPIIPKLLSALELDSSDEIPVMFLTRQMKAIGRHWGYRFVPWLPNEKKN